MRGAIFKIEKDFDKEIRNFLKKTIVKKFFGAILIPCKVPANDSYAYLLIRDEALIEKASILPPVMPIQGGRVLKSFTRLGKIDAKVAVIMRPCEIRASIELSKLEQVDLTNVTLISVDCPGVIPLSDYLEDPVKGTDTFKEAFKTWESDSVRELCKVCYNFTLTGSDLHIGILGSEQGNLFLIPVSEKGRNLLDFFNINYENDISSWENIVKKKEDERKIKRKEFRENLRQEIEGIDNLLKTFSDCLNCHNCMRVCPICYCRQCFFDSDALNLPSTNYIKRAENRGSIKFPPETLLFHLGRMSHMITSCVSCGSCEDACPVSLPISRVFSFVAENVQNLFNYVPGMSVKDPVPTITYEEEELKEFENPYIETYNIQRM
ncbi:hypothetical protein DRQ09_04330 [candidate division KSB1 bacterium]|nr:MAG: hypothetical protein DRQ09_04330 [candidate division KSB1 bacterium]